MTNPLRLLRAVVCTLALAAIFTSPVFAQQKKILLLAADSMGPEVVQQRLIETNRFAQVDLIRVDHQEGVPDAAVTLPQLLAYDAVVTWSTTPTPQPDSLGDVLSQYVDAGHGVVQAPFTFFDDPTLTLGGRWRDLGYDALTMEASNGFPGSRWSRFRRTIRFSPGSMPWPATIISGIPD